MHTFIYTILGLFYNVYLKCFLFSLQFSGQDVTTGKIVEVARDGVVPISGKMVLDNHSVNLISSILTALFLPKVALALGL